MYELGDRLGEIVPAVYAAALAQDNAPTQPPFMRYLDMNMEEGTLDFEAGFPVTSAFADATPVQAGTLPGGEVAVLWHIGPYHELGARHDRLTEWIDTHGRQPGDARWEVYWTDPGEEPDSSRWRTEIIQTLLPLSE
jgi:effector-binding domain-containing protein